MKTHSTVHLVAAATVASLLALPGYAKDKPGEAPEAEAAPKAAPEAVRAKFTELGAEYLVDCSVGRMNGTVQIHASLVDPETEGQPWGDVYNDIDAESVPALVRVQTDIVQQIAGALNVVVPTFGIVVSCSPAMMARPLTLLVRPWSVPMPRVV